MRLEFPSIRPCKSLLTVLVLALGATGCVGSLDEAAQWESQEAVGVSTASLQVGGTFIFQSGVTTSRCMDVAGGSSTDGTNIRQWTCNYSLAQKYRVEAVPGGVRLVNLASNKCVDVDGNHLEDLTNVQLWQCNNTGAQTFRVTDTAAGLNLIHIASGRCVGVADGNPAQGTNIRIRGCNGSAAQTWVAREAAGPVRIMPLGASITQGFGGTHAGYRWLLSQLLDQTRVPHLFVGSRTDGSSPLPPEQSHHEGHPGWVIADGNGDDGLRRHIDEWLGASGADPQIVLLLVGSNDVARDIDVANSGRRLDDLIGRIRTLKPAALIYVSTIPRVDSRAAGTVQYNDQLRSVVLAREQRGEAVHLIDSYTPLEKPGLKADGIHPNDAGYDIIARLWLNAILGQ
jgi:hypothetical protein